MTDKLNPQIYSEPDGHRYVSAENYEALLDELLAIRQQARSIDDEFEECREQIAAVTQERDQMAAKVAMLDKSTEVLNKSLQAAHEHWVEQHNRSAEIIAQLQARNKTLRDALETIRGIAATKDRLTWNVMFDAICGYCDAALTEEAQP